MRWRQVPFVVLAVMVAQLLLGLAYAATNPVWAAPDEEQQLSTVIALAEDGSYPPPAVARWVPSVANSHQYVPDILPARRTVAPIPPPIVVSPLPSFDELAEMPLDGEPPVNQLTQHAPGFAIVMAVPWLALQMGEWPLDLAVFGMRMLNCLMMVALTPLIWAGARRLGASRAAASLGVLVPLLVPEFTWWSATINNDHLVTLAVGVLTYAGIRIATGDNRRRTYVVAGVALGIGLFSKLFAVTGIVLLVLVAFAGWRRARRLRAPVPVLGRLVLALGTAFALGGWWYVLNVLRYGAIQPNGMAIPRVGPADTLTYVQRAPIGMVTAYFWSPGVLETPMPLNWAWTGAAIVAVLVLVGAYRVRNLTISTSLVAVTLLTMAIVFAGSYATYTATGQIRGMQGRYLYVGIVGLAVLIGCVLPAARTVSRIVALAAALAALALQALALDDLVTIYHGGDLGAAGFASPVSPWLVLAAVVVAAGALLAAYTAALVRPEPDDPGPAAHPRPADADPAVAGTEPAAVGSGSVSSDSRPTAPPGRAPGDAAGSHRSRT